MLEDVEFKATLLLSLIYNQYLFYNIIVLLFPVLVFFPSYLSDVGLVVLTKLEGKKLEGQPVVERLVEGRTVSLLSCSTFVSLWSSSTNIPGQDYCAPQGRVIA